MDKQIHGLKKVMLHQHLDGSLRPETVRDWLKEDGTDLDLETVKTKLMVSKDCRNLNEYLEKFDLPLRCLQTQERIRQATFETFEDSSKQNVIYSEVRFAPSLHLTQGLSYDDVVKAAVVGMCEAKEKYGIKGGLILCSMRGENNLETNKQTVLTAKKFLGKGVVAVDLAGAEALFPTSDYKEIFALAREEGVPFTIHSGEADGIRSMESALSFGTKRIGHGIRCIESKALMERLKQDKVLLEICPTSNLQTQAVQGKYPLEEIYRSGIRVNINTDNDTVSNTNIEEEYNWILQNTKLGLEDLVNMNIFGMEGAFCPREEKDMLLSELFAQKKQIEKAETIR